MSSNRSPKLKLDNINALAELDKLAIKYTPAGQDELRVFCPVHEMLNGKLLDPTSSPSCYVNIKKNLWTCQAASCKAHGDIVSFLAFTLSVTRDIVLVELQKRYDLGVKKTINPTVIEQFHNAIWESGPLVQALYERGITNDMINKARIGYQGGRITIPIFDRDGSIIECRRYLPGAPGPEKMRNTPGFGGLHLYQIDQLKYPIIWICGGEMKALVAGWYLNQHGIGAVSATAGEGNWDHAWSPFLKDKLVYICMDVDKGGLIAATKIAGYVFNYANATNILRLPLDRVKYPKGDINDYVGREKATDTDLIRCMENAERWYPPEIAAENEGEAKNIQLSEACNSEQVGRRLKIHAVVSGLESETYLIPRTVLCKCTKDQPNCTWCPIRPKEPDDNGFMEAKVSSLAEGLLEMINAGKKTLDTGMKEALHIPPCKAVEFTVKEHYNVTEAKLSPQLNIGSDTAKNVVQSAYIVGKDIEMNTPYIFTGKLYPNPKNQHAILLLNEKELGQDSLDSFKPEDLTLDQLQLFQPKTWTKEAVTEKLKDLYDDFECNVTRIFHRHDLHLAVDLCFHSVLMMKFDGQEVKGWVNVLIAGDSSQGKSETAAGYDGNGGLMKHYGLGERVDCKNATTAGLLGGLQTIGNKFFISWGVIPTHDRRLVILEEFGGTNPEVLSKLTDMRSSGIAEIPKIQKHRAFARTRLLFISNPRSNRSVAEHNFGVEIIRSLLHKPEDVRRLDFALLVSNKQVKADQINKIRENRPVCEHRHTTTMCQTLVLWAWTRKIDQIIFDDNARSLIMEEASKLSTEFSEAIPLVDSGTMRIKIARLACAVAARTYSTDDRQVLVIRKCHIEFIVDFIRRVYGDPIFGYKDFTKAQHHANSVADPELVVKHIAGTKHPADFVRNLLYEDSVTMTDICDWCELDREMGQQTLSFLVRKHALYREGREYKKTSEFITLLKRIQEAGGLKKTASADQEKELF